MANNTFFLLAMCLIGLTLSSTVEAQNSPKDYLDAHNKIRAAVGVPPVTWNKTLEAIAKKYVKARIDTCEFEHEYGPDYGQNLVMGYGDFSGVDAVKAWTDERALAHYKHDHPIQESDVPFLHYTQVVWSKTTQIGCARGRCKNEAILISCNYAPCGNVIGEYPY